jgi:hypothetical protein
VHGLESDWGDRIRFVYLDIDDPRNDEFKADLGYYVQPHIFLLDSNGAVLHQWLGLVDRADLEPAFREATS